MLTRVIRLKLARPARLLRALATAEHPPPLPPLSSLNLPAEPTGPFPLYHPPPPSHRSSTSSGFGYDPAAKVPSDRAIRARVKQKLTQAVEAGLPEYTEEELRGFYAAVVQSGAEAGKVGDAGPGIAGPSRQAGRLIRPPGRQTGQDTGSIMEGLAGRLIPSFDVEAADRSEATMAGRSLGLPRLPPHQALQNVTRRLAQLAEEQEHATGSSSSGTSRSYVPLGLVSRTESRTLLGEAVRLADPSALILLLDLLPRLGILVEREQISELLRSVTLGGRRSTGRGTAASRDLSQAERDVFAVLTDIVMDQEELLPAEADSLVRVQLIADRSGTSAISLLRRYETLSRPLPQSGYALVLAHLTGSSATSTSASRADAWDLFAHMRLVAHPNPSAEVYRTMIAACAASSDPKPEMARDLWLQMTQETPVDGEDRAEPAGPEYTAYIRALCSTRGTYLEGFDVFRQMLARHGEATYVPFRSGGEYSNGSSRYLPTTETWKALLEGAKRAGDLPRARWVLSECVRLQDALGGRAGTGLDEEIIASAFMAYAAFKPVVRRTAIRDRATTSANEDDGASPSQLLDTPNAQQTEIEMSQTEAHGSGMFPSQAPMTGADAIREARLLFRAVLNTAQGQNAVPSDFAPPSAVFAGVNITARLVNSYLSVIYAHASTIRDCQRAWRDSWESVKVEPNGWSYLHLFERCAVGQRGRDRSAGTDPTAEREAGLQWAEEAWPAYLDARRVLFGKMKDSSPDASQYSAGVGPRQTERCYRALIRANALCNRLAESLAVLDQFHQDFPPESITETYTPTTSHDFALRFSDPTTVGESDVPPHLLFVDVDVLHQRLVRDERWKEVGRVKYVCQTYEKALARRRKWRLKGSCEGGRRVAGPPDTCPSIASFNRPSA